TRGSLPSRSAFSARARSCASYTIGVEICGIDRRARLLPPGFIQSTGVHSIESELVNQTQHDSLSRSIVAGDGQGDSPRSALGPAQLAQVLGINVVERFDYRPAELFLNPSALWHTIFDLADATVALLRLIIACIHS